MKKCFVSFAALFLTLSTMQVFAETDAPLEQAHTENGLNDITVVAQRVVDQKTNPVFTPTAVNASDVKINIPTEQLSENKEKKDTEKNQKKKEDAHKDNEETQDLENKENADDLKKLEDDYEAKKANEQSMANKTLTAVTTAATGIGGMELAMGLSEQKADKDAANDMAAYIATMRCTYGDGKQVKAGPDEIELPGANNADLMKLRSEYLALATDLKERKTALGMKPGIESEEILDKASSGLYDDENIGIDSGAYASLYRAQMLGSETDQAKIDEDAKASKNRVMGGAIAAGAGAVIGIGGNMLINGELGEKLKANKNCKAMQQFVKEEETELKNLKTCLKKAGVKNSDKLTLDSVTPLYPSLLSINKLDCDKDLEKAKGKTAEELFKDISKDNTDNNEKIISNMVERFGAKATGKLLDINVSDDITPTEKTDAAKKLKEKAEAKYKQFEEAKQKDEKSGCNLGVTTGKISKNSNIANQIGSSIGKNFDLSNISNIAQQVLPSTQ